MDVKRDRAPAGRVSDDLVERAIAAGASAAAVVRPDQVVTAEWVRWKCLYGCPSAGTCLTCPPHAPTPEQTRTLLDEYETLLLVRFDVRPDVCDRAQARRWVLETGLKLERELFLAGHHKAFALAGGRPCERDETCGAPETCVSRERLRPGLAGCGVDVFGTATNSGWPLDVVAAGDDSYHRFALVLVD